MWFKSTRCSGVVTIICQHSIQQNLWTMEFTVSPTLDRRGLSAIYQSCLLADYIRHKHLPFVYVQRLNWTIYCHALLYIYIPYISTKTYTLDKNFKRCRLECVLRNWCLSPICVGNLLLLLSKWIRIEIIIGAEEELASQGHRTSNIKMCTIKTDSRRIHMHNFIMKAEVISLSRIPHLLHTTYQ